MSATMKPILVTGDSGQLGHAVTYHLLTTTKLHPHNIIATTRVTSRLEDFAAPGVRVRYADFNEQETLYDRFDGRRQPF